MISGEQQHAIDTLLRDDVELVKTDSVAGSGKSTLAKAISDVLPGKHLYTSFMKSATNEALTKFDIDKVDVKTTHALCYKTVVSQGISMPGIKYGKRKVRNFKYFNVSDLTKYDDRAEVVKTMDEFFTSRYVSLTEFLKTTAVSEVVKGSVILHVGQMAKKEIPCSHGFYMKYYHILLHRGVVPKPKYSLAILDEAQDSSGVALEIFKLIDSPKKLVVGDPHQNCMGFANSVNGFEILKDEGVETKLTTSYRLSTELAEKVQKFGTKYLDSDFTFKGVDIEDKTINSTVYIARTNGALIAKMIELNRSNVEYNLPREPSKMFGTLLDLIGLKPGVKRTASNSGLVDDMNDYYQTNMEKSLFSFILKRHPHDKSLKTAIKTVVKYGGKVIWDTFNIAKAHDSSDTTFPLSLGTPHSTKGGTYDKVILDDDMYPDFLSDPGTMSEEEIQSELNLVYIAITRCRVQLDNARWLDEL